MSEVTDEFPAVDKARRLAARAAVVIRSAQGRQSFTSSRMAPEIRKAARRSLWLASREAER